MVPQVGGGPSAAAEVSTELPLTSVAVPTLSGTYGKWIPELLTEGHLGDRSAPMTDKPVLRGSRSAWPGSSRALLGGCLGWVLGSTIAAESGLQFDGVQGD